MTVEYSEIFAMEQQRERREAAIEELTSQGYKVTLEKTIGGMVRTEYYYPETEGGAGK